MYQHEDLTRSVLVFCAARVRALEERMLQLQGLAQQGPMPEGGSSGSHLGEGSVIVRVDNLEQAVLALTRVQVRRLHNLQWFSNLETLTMSKRC